jgi:nicotinamide-nucleotide amidase
MRAAVVAIGSELLGVERLDTNSLLLTRCFEQYGVTLERKLVLGDSEQHIARELRRLADEVDFVVVTGGLGPTADDVTRHGVALAFDRSVAVDEAAARGIEERFRRLGLTMAAVNRRQAELIEGAEWVPNELGSAPGLLLTERACTVLLLPGVPRELTAMIETALEPLLAARSGGAGLERRVIKVACVPESGLEERIAPAYEDFGREAITVLAKPGEIQVWASAAGSRQQRFERLEGMLDRLQELIGDAAYTRDQDASLESVIGEALTGRGHSLATAESCTGGLVATRITDVAGSSAYFRGGAVAYSNDLKSRLAGVPEELIEGEGAVSEAVARALARGACERFAADWGIGVTGIAGPGGGSEHKPVGTVHLAVARRDGPVSHLRRRFPGGRARVRVQSAQWVLEMLRRRLLELPELS